MRERKRHVHKQTLSIQRRFRFKKKMNRMNETSFKLMRLQVYKVADYFYINCKFELSRIEVMLRGTMNE